jgi:hypothetical protein
MGMYIPEKVKKAVLQVYGRTLIFKNPDIEREYTGWNHPNFKASTQISLASLFVLSIIHTFLDAVTYCDDSLENISPSICRDAENGNFLKIARLGCIVSWLAFSLLVVSLRLVEKPHIMQSFFVVSLFLTNTVLMYISFRINQPSTTPKYMTGPDGDMTKVFILYEIFLQTEPNIYFQIVFHTYIVNNLMMACMGSALHVGYYKLYGALTFGASIAMFGPTLAKDFRFIFSIILVDGIGAK